MLVGHMCGSKADRSQVLDLQRAALLAAGVKPERLFEDHASGKRDDRPGLEACLKTLRKGDRLVHMEAGPAGRDRRHLGIACWAGKERPNAFPQPSEGTDPCRSRASSA